MRFIMGFLTHNLQLPVFTSKHPITVSPTINTLPFLLRHCMYFFKFNTAKIKCPSLYCICSRQRTSNRGTGWGRRHSCIETCKNAKSWYPVSWCHAETSETCDMLMRSYFTVWIRKNKEPNRWLLNEERKTSVSLQSLRINCVLMRTIKNFTLSAVLIKANIYNYFLLIFIRLKGKAIPVTDHGGR
jgi:hypothetical protein